MGDNVHIDVIDGWGNMVSATPWAVAQTSMPMRQGFSPTKNCSTWRRCNCRPQHQKRILVADPTSRLTNKSRRLALLEIRDIPERRPPRPSPDRYRRPNGYVLD